MMIIWIHGYMGLVIWRSNKSWWPRIAGYVYPYFVAIQLSALLGYVEADKRVIEVNKNTEFTDPARNILTPGHRYSEVVDPPINIVLALYLPLFTVLDNSQISNQAAL